MPRVIARIARAMGCFAVTEGLERVLANIAFSYLRFSRLYIKCKVEGCRNDPSLHPHRFEVRGRSSNVGGSPGPSGGSCVDQARRRNEGNGRALISVRRCLLSLSL
jgi:hypothetical protein